MEARSRPHYVRGEERLWAMLANADKVCYSPGSWTGAIVRIETESYTNTMRHARLGPRDWAVRWGY
jgi:hypothetical protein